MNRVKPTNKRGSITQDKGIYQNGKLTNLRIKNDQNQNIQDNKSKFAKNNKVLNAKNDAAKKLPNNIQFGKELGKGGFGKVLELKNNRDYVVKIPHAKDYRRFLSLNKAAKEEFEKAEKIREIINNYINNYDFGGAQGLDNVAAPVLITQGQSVYGKTNELVMPKADGKDGFVSIFGKFKEGKEELPLEIYGNRVIDGAYSINPKEKGKALSIALQKVMILRALSEAGYANIDTKLENIMISEDGKVSMIDVGSIVKQGTKISGGFTPTTAAPEVWNINNRVNSQADVFSDAIDRPCILFGGIAEKYIPQLVKMDKNDIDNLRGKVGSERINRYMDNFKDAGIIDIEDMVFPLSWKFMSYEKATDLDVKEEIKKYKDAGFQEPTFPKDFTNAQKMRYIYYHLGFLKIQKEIGKVVYPPKVLDSLAKLQALATDPDPSERLSCKDVEDTLLHLMMSSDRWEGKNAVFRIGNMKITPWSMPDQILPKNEVHEESETQNKNHDSNAQNEVRKPETRLKLGSEEWLAWMNSESTRKKYQVAQKIRLHHGNNMRNKVRDNDSAVWMNKEQLHNFIKERNLPANKAKNKDVIWNQNLDDAPSPMAERLLADVNRNGIKLNLENKESPKRVQKVRLHHGNNMRNKVRDNDSAVWMNEEQLHNFIKERNLQVKLPVKKVNNKGVMRNQNLDDAPSPMAERLLADVNRNGIKLNLKNKESPKRVQKVRLHHKQNLNKAQEYLKKQNLGKTESKK